jgi:hypothetical protein
MTAHTTGHESSATVNKAAPYAQHQVDALTTEVRMVTAAEARAWRDACHFERQRNIRTPHVKRLALEMSHGWFLAGTPIWFCVMPDKSMVIVNGNHTLEAIAESGVTIPLTFVYQQVASLDEAAQAYACFDIQRTRTWGQAARATGIDEGLPAPGHTIAAVGMIQCNFSPSGNMVGVASRSARFELVEEYRAAAHLIHAAMLGSPPGNQNLIHRASVYAVALATARYQPATAEEFWGGMAMDDGLRANDARKVLLRYLQNNPADGSNKRRDQALGAANAWNAYFDNKRIDHLKPSQTTAFVLAGTPWGKSGATGPLPVIRKTAASAGAVLGKRINGVGGSHTEAVYGARN